MKSITLSLIRHGETYFNIFHEFQGWSDTPLTPAGVTQIHQLAHQLRSLPITAVYASDVTRARQTATILCHDATWPITTIHFRSALREHFYGRFEGQKMTTVWEPIAQAHGCQTYEDLVTQYGVDQTQDWLSAADPSHLTETSQAFWARFLPGLAAIMAEQPDQAHVLLISHSSIIRSLVARYAPSQLDPITPENGKLTQLTLNQTVAGKLSIQIKTYNQTRLNN
ncbi:histidine phosphatase family protein [Lactiplantibacillus paraplantarum]|uniref:Histidine phosphatase family protein n=1 Tax=Lactiplantibacillus paraplantarum TaxID=60520 RepID=A0A4Q9XZA3_9LACO|nr:histidine phosphatase family protein [Lactiplantibacillus paraplantarum]MCT4456071.1 histidine phosphatase family protein [Lactiplantibacillus paraplantarum]TBX39338.1 histidine phosphatase family protein [Lactiplantibacillus paraplantarum]